MPEKDQKTVAVIGGGSWATALVKILSENSDQIFWWLRKSEDVEHIKKFRHNRSYLSDVEINPEKVSPTTDLGEALSSASIVFVAVPGAFLVSSLSLSDQTMFRDKIIVSAIKGMVPDMNMFVSSFFESCYDLTGSSLCMVSGPCHSEEVAMEKQSYLTIAGSAPDATNEIAEMLSCRFIKTSVSHDLYGVECAAVMKNIYAIAGGIARGLNYGDNFQAVLVAAAMQEMENYLDHFFPAERQISDLVYLGDLLVTCYSQFSRNRTLGNMLGRGYSVKSALVEMNMVAEGFYGVKSLYGICLKADFDAPIIRAVYNILYEKISPSIEFKILENLL